MFVLVQNGSVVLGPNDWNKKKFQYVLKEELELDVELPVSLDSYLEINESVKIYPVVFAAPPVVNPKIEIMHGPFWDFTGNVATASYQPLSKAIDTVKNELIGALANKRWQKETEGITITLQDKLVWVTTKRNDRDIFLQAVQLNKDNAAWKLNEAMGDPRNEGVFLPGNTVWLTLSIAELQQIVTAITNKVQGAFDWEQGLAGQINAATSLEELNAIEF